MFSEAQRPAAEPPADRPMGPTAPQRYRLDAPWPMGPSIETIPPYGIDHCPCAVWGAVHQAIFERDHEGARQSGRHSLSGAELRL